MSENVKGIMLFSEHLQGYEMLTDTQLGCLVRALFADCGLREQPQMDAVTQLVFQLVAPATRQALAKWQNRDRANQENGKKGGRPPKEPKGKTEKQQKPMGLKEKPMGFDDKTEKPMGCNHINHIISKVKENTNVFLSKSGDFDEQNEQPVEQEINMEQGELVPQRKKGILPCPQQKILSLYAEILPELPQVQELRANVQRDVSARWKEKCKKRQWTTEQDGLEYFKKFFSYVSHNNWLMGRAEGNNGWVCDYRWLMRASNFDAVTSGKYARHQA